MQIQTKYLSTSENDLKIAADILRNGGTVIFPTETVYGLGADALDPDASEKIFAAKGRPSDNPLIIHIADSSKLPSLVSEIPEIAQILMDRFWPGPLTLIFKKSDKIPKTVTGGLDTVAIRMPNQPVANQLLTLADIPIAAPSANLSGKPSPTTFRHVKNDMDGRVNAIIDGGSCQVGVESTVLDISGEIPVLYRPGEVTLEQLESLIGEVQVVTKTKEGETPKSPGLKYKHYAPEAEVQILHGSLEQVKDYIRTIASTKKVGVLTFDEFPALSDDCITYSLGSLQRPEEAANRLFTALRELDSHNVSYILAPEIPETGIWRAVKNRLYRAAGETVINLTKQILFVCTGNTCRSPMAAGILSSIAKDAVSVFSAGIFADGSSVSDNAVVVMKELGIDISDHISACITQEAAADASIILTMTSSHKQLLISMFPQFKDKTMTLAEWAEEDTDISDPYGGDLEVYRHCRDELMHLIEKGWRNSL